MRSNDKLENRLLQLKGRHFRGCFLCTYLKSFLLIVSLLLINNLFPSLFKLFSPSHHIEVWFSKWASSWSLQMRENSTRPPFIQCNPGRFTSVFYFLTCQMAVTRRENTEMSCTKLQQVTGWEAETREVHQLTTAGQKSKQTKMLPFLNVCSNWYFHDSLERITRLQRASDASISCYCMNFPDCCPYKPSKGANTSCFTFFHPLSPQPMEILSELMTSFFFQLFG